MAGGELCHSVMVVVGGNPSSPRWGGTLSSHDGGTPSSHGAGTNPHLGWVDTIPGMGLVRGTPSKFLAHSRYGLGGGTPSQFLAINPLQGVPTLARGNYLGQEGTSSNVGYLQSGNLPPYPRVHTPPSPSTLTRGTYLGRGGTSLNEGTTARICNP